MCPAAAAAPTDLAGSARFAGPSGAAAPAPTVSRPSAPPSSADRETPDWFWVRSGEDETFAERLLAGV